MERVIKSTVNRHGDYVCMTQTDNVRPWYTIYSPDGYQRFTSQYIEDAEKEYERWAD